MKKLLFVFLLGAFAACGGSGSDSTTDTTGAAMTDTSSSSMSSGAMSSDTSSKMGADTGTMMTDTSSMSTPH